MQAYRWVIDSRDQFTDERLEMLGGDMKLGECYQIGLCSLTCPKGLNPRAALKHLKDLYADYEERKSTQQVTIWSLFLTHLLKYYLKIVAIISQSFNNLIKICPISV